MQSIYCILRMERRSLADDAQELYEEKLDEKSRKTAATVQSITDEILKESLALTTDSSAEEVVDTTTESLNTWLINAWVCTRPLLERWWNPIFDGTVTEFDAFMAKVRTDVVGFSWGLTCKASKSTMTKEKRIIGQFMRVRGQANSRSMAEFRLTDQFDKELQKQQLKATAEDDNFQRLIYKVNQDMGGFWAGYRNEPVVVYPDLRLKDKKNPNGKPLRQFLNEADRVSSRPL